MYYVYILKCADKSLYTGITNDLQNRLRKHKEGMASKYTRAKRAVKFVYTEKQRSRSAALKREAEIKRWSRQKKLQLIKLRRQ
jgi:putative endonuclease